MTQVISDIALIISTTLMYATPLIFGAMGSIMSERSGVVNIGIEGIMTMGAFAGVTAAIYTHNPWLSFLIAGLAGAFFGLLHAIATVTYKSDQTISGIAINFIAPGFAVFLCKYLFNGSTMTPSVSLDEKIPRYFDGIFAQNSPLDMIFNTYFTVYLAFLLVIGIYFLLFKTRFGLRVRAIGEHPRAADTLGIPVFRIKYICVILSGFLAGLGGASISLAIVSAYRPNIISGQGFIAIAAVIFGQYKPQNAMLAALLFGCCQGLVVYLGNPRIGVNISESLLTMIPYIVTIIVMVLFVGKSAGPAAGGKPYEK